MPTPKVYRQKATTRANDEAKMQEVIDSFNAGEHKSLRAATLAFGMKTRYHSIWRRAGGKVKPRCKAHMRQQLLNHPQEQVLVNWIKFLGFAGMPLSKRTIAPKVVALCGRKPSRRWVYRFLARHSECTLGRPAGLDPKRARAFNFTMVNDHFEKLQRLLSGHNICARNFWNTDEIGIQLGGDRKSDPELYLFAWGDESRYKIKSDALELVTIIEAICADGTAEVMPCFIFSGVKFCEEWFIDQDNILVATTENGWTSEKMCKEWFIKNFIPAARAHADPDPSIPVVLMYDGHNSHFSVDLIDAALEHNVILFALPSHTTHRLQPCDVGAFSPLKRAWLARCQAIIDETGEQMHIKNVVQEYMKARESSFKEETIRQAFTKSGIYTNDEGQLVASIGIFSKEDFAPSIPTSTQRHLPVGFPEDHGDILDDDTQISEPDYISSSESGLDSGSNNDRAESISEFDDDDDSPAYDRNESDTTDSSHDATYTHTSDDPNDDDACSNRNYTLDGTRDPATNWIAAHPLIQHYADSEDEDDEPASDWTDAEKTAFWKARCMRLHARVTKTREQRDSATAHAILAGRENETLKARANAKKMSKGRTVTIAAKIVSTQEGRAEAARQRQAREDKEEKSRKAKEKRQDEECERRRLRQEKGKDGMIFEGTLNSQLRGTLTDIAWSLGLKEDGTKEELQARISTHVSENLALREDSRYTALFAKRGRKRTVPYDSEPSAPNTTQPLDATDPSEPGPSKRQHLGTVTNTPTHRRMVYDPPNLPPLPALQFPCTNPYPATPSSALEHTRIASHPHPYYPPMPSYTGPAPSGYFYPAFRVYQPPPD